MCLHDTDSNILILVEVFGYIDIIDINKMKILNQINIPDYMPWILRISMKLYEVQSTDIEFPI